MKMDYSPTPSPKVSSKWMKDLVIRPATIKSIKQRFGNDINFLPVSIISDIDDEYAFGWI